jgi:hypothetical protein
MEDIITSSNEVLKCFESDMAVETRKLDNSTQETAGNNDSAMQTAGS